MYYDVFFIEFDFTNLMWIRVIIRNIQNSDFVCCLCIERPDCQSWLRAFFKCDSLPVGRPICSHLNHRFRLQLAESDSMFFLFLRAALSRQEMEHLPILDRLVLTFFKEVFFYGDTRAALTQLSIVVLSRCWVTLSLLSPDPLSQIVVAMLNEVGLQL